MKMKIVQAIGFGFIGLIALCVLMGSGVVPGAYNTVENNGTPLTKRSILNFPNSGCTDNSGNQSTDCTFLTATTVPGNYTQTFTSQTSVTLTHNLNTTAVIVQCYDAASPPALIIPNTTKITDANDVTVTFSASQSGKCQVSGSNASGGGGGGGGNNILGQIYVDTPESTTSTSYVDLGTADSVTFTIAATQTVIYQYSSTVFTAGGCVAFNQANVDGTLFSGLDQANNISGGAIAPSIYALTESLAAGTHTIKIQHKTNGGSCQWQARTFYVLGHT